MKQMLMNLYLLWGAIQDLKEKKISLLYLKVGVMMGLLFFIGDIKRQDITIGEIIFSFLPGILFLIAAKISREKIGFGDGWLFLIVACWVGMRETWALWQISLVLSSIFSFVMLITKKYSRSYCMAFVPFVWLAHLLLWSLYYGK